MSGEPIFRRLRPAQERWGELAHIVHASWLRVLADRAVDLGPPEQPALALAFQAV